MKNVKTGKNNPKSSDKHNRLHEKTSEECAKGNEKKNATRARAIQTKTRGAKNEKKERQLDEEHFGDHLNEGSKSEQPTRQVNLRDDGVDIDLPSREEIEETLKYLKKNKAAGVDSIAA
jgi:hypothetical protein